MQALYGGLGAIDINGSPKLFSRKVFEQMDLRSADWFLDPEIIVKAHHLGLRVIEIDVEGYARHGGVSNVRLDTCVEFVGNIGRYRFGDALEAWRRDVTPLVDAGVAPHPPTPAAPPSAAGEPGPLPGVRLLHQRRHSDDRGYLHKILSSSQTPHDLGSGEVYVTAARPGELKGGHYHRRMGEWFAVIQGNGELRLADPQTGEQATLELRAVRPLTVYVPPGIAHAVVNTGKRSLVCVAWAEGEHDPGDVHAHDVG